MKELLYFSSSDLMIQVSYTKTLNSIEYFSHRDLSFAERVIVEQYLLTNIAVKTDYYKREPATLKYAGVYSKLVRDLNQYHLKNSMVSLSRNENEVHSSVKNLIDQSMSSYYFEQIGDAILEIRELVGNVEDDELNSYKSRLTELVNAYNMYSEDQVNVQDVLPAELKSFF